MGVEALARAAAYRFDDMVDATLRVYATAVGETASAAAHEAPVEVSQ